MGHDQRLFYAVEPRNIFDNYSNVLYNEFLLQSL